jgi:hypothetical protein
MACHHEYMGFCELIRCISDLLRRDIIADLLHNILDRVYASLSALLIRHILRESSRCWLISSYYHHRHHATACWYLHHESCEKLLAVTSHAGNMHRHWRWHFLRTGHGIGINVLRQEERHGSWDCHEWECPWRHHIPACRSRDAAESRVWLDSTGAWLHQRCVLGRGHCIHEAKTAT